jgi:RNA polymerase sigma-70 factor (ECF subfamily)
MKLTLAIFTCDWAGCAAEVGPDPEPVAAGLMRHAGWHVAGGRHLCPVHGPDAPAEVVRELVGRAQAGQPGAFAAIYERYRDTVFRFVHSRVGGWQLAEDLTSEVFLRALNRIGSFTWQGRDPGAWLVTIARNLVADHYKSGRYRLERPVDSVPDEAPRGVPPDAQVGDRVAGGQARDHWRQVLSTAVDRLTPKQREVLELRFFAGLSIADTAALIGCDESVVKTAQFRAVRALARQPEVLALRDDLTEVSR